MIAIEILTSSLSLPPRIVYNLATTERLVMHFEQPIVGRNKILCVSGRRVEYVQQYGDRGQTGHVWMHLFFGYGQLDSWTTPA